MVVKINTTVVTSSLTHSPEMYLMHTATVLMSLTPADLPAYAAGGCGPTQCFCQW